MVVDPDNKPSLNFGLAAVVYEWARGVSFRDITQVGAYEQRVIPLDCTRLITALLTFHPLQVPTNDSSLSIASVSSPPDHHRPCYYFVRGR